MSETIQFFRRHFPQLSGIPSGAYHWQEELFGQFVKGIQPMMHVCLPTGMGKTSVMHAWLLALAWEAVHCPQKRCVATRLVWVVDRRVVVDQATTEAERIVHRIENAPDDELRKALQNLSVARDLTSGLAVSTLRGEFADNRKWSRDPLRPAIIVGTVDMIGSRLLFSGYGDTRRRRALHAALLGQDSLVVNDEAHLTPAFADLLGCLREFTGGERPLRTMLLSATPRDHVGSNFPSSLDQDLKNDHFRARYRATKHLHVSVHDDPKKAIQKLAAEPDRRTIIFVRSPEEARKLALAIEGRHKGTHVPLLTGVQRGWERDRLLDDDVVKRYLSKEPPTSDANANPCWMVATSAGEVGIDLSSDRLITDLDTADHLLQRFGRLNRFGETSGDAHVLYSPKQVSGEKTDALRETLTYLKALPDVSPETLLEQPPPPCALSDKPTTVPLLPWHIDVWSMTSISAKEWPSRPSVEPWLRGGDEEAAPPETYVAWRDDVEDLANPGVSPRDRDEVFDCYPVIAQERLKQYTRALCDALEHSSYLSRPAILIAADGEVYAEERLAVLLKRADRFRYATLVLPPGVGYLDANGMVDWERSTADISQEALGNYDRSGTETRSRLYLAPGEAQPEAVFRWRYTVQVPAADESEEGPRWMYFAGKLVQKASQTEVLLSDHREHVAKVAADLARRTGLDHRRVQVFEWAGRWHDAGKDREIWQRAARNKDFTRPVAKAERLNGRSLDGYRHELGSLLDAKSQIPSDFTEDERDLALYLVAAHHGWGRPHFPDRTFDRTHYRESGTAALECARRFGRLHRRYGAWGLAYLESIFRSADAIASADGPELPVNA